MDLCQKISGGVFYPAFVGRRTVRVGILGVEVLRMVITDTIVIGYMTEDLPRTTQKYHLC